VTSCSRRQVGRQQRSFDNEGARAAHGIDQWSPAIPAQQHQNTCRQGFAQRGLGRLFAIAAAVQQLTGGIDRNLTLIVVKAHENELLFPLSFPRLAAKGTIDGGSDCFGDTPAMHEPGTMARRFHPDSGLPPEEAPPGQTQGLFVQVGKVATAKGSETDHHATGRTQPQVGAIDIRQASRELHSARHHGDSGHTELVQLGSADCLQSWSRHRKKLSFEFFHSPSPQRSERRS